MLFSCSNGKTSTRGQRSPQELEVGHCGSFNCRMRTCARILNSNNSGVLRFYSVHCTVYILQCKGSREQIKHCIFYTVEDLECWVYSVNSTLYSVHFTLYRFYSGQCHFTAPKSS